ISAAPLRERNNLRAQGDWDCQCGKDKEKKRVRKGTNECDPLRSAQPLLTYMGVKGKKNRPVQARVRVAGRQLALGGHTLRLGVPPETADGRSCVHCDGTGHRAEPSSTTSDHERCVMHIRLRSLT